MSVTILDVMRKRALWEAEHGRHARTCIVSPKVEHDLKMDIGSVDASIATFSYVAIGSRVRHHERFCGMDFYADWRLQGDDYTFDSARIVTREEALVLVKELNSLFHEQGYLLGLYGSTLTEGCGRDVDLMANPWRPAMDGALESELVRCGWEVRERTHGYYAEALALERDGVRIDVRLGR